MRVLVVIGDRQQSAFKADSSTLSKDFSQKSSYFQSTTTM